MIERIATFLFRLTVALAISPTISCKVHHTESLTQAEGGLAAGELDDRLTPFPQTSALSNDDIARIAKEDGNGNQAFEMYRRLLSEIAWNRPSSESFGALGITQAPADFIRESSSDGKLFLVRVPNGMRLLGSDRFQAFLRELNLFIIAGKLNGPSGVSRMLDKGSPRDLPRDLNQEFANGQAAADFGGVGLRRESASDLIITINLANVSELRSRQAVTWLGSHVLTQDFYGVREIAPVDVQVIPQFANANAIREFLVKKFGEQSAAENALTKAEIDGFVERIILHATVNETVNFTLVSALPFMWNWQDSYMGAWPKAVHRRLGIDTIRSLLKFSTINRETLSAFVTDYRDATRVLQQYEHSLEPKSGLERYDLSMLPIETNAIDVNKEEGNFEITAKMPVAPRLRKIHNDTTGKDEYVETLIDLSFEEKRALLREYAEILAKLHGPSSTVKDVSSEGGNHGHTLVIKYIVTVQTDQGQHEYTVELDGQSREYNVEDGEFKVAMNTVRGGSLEAVGGKQRMTQAYLLLRFFAAEQIGLFPLRQSGGGHLTTGLQSFMESAKRTGNARALARMFWLVHRYQAVFGFMVMDPLRVKGAIPFYFSPRTDADRVPAQFESGRQPIKNIDELLNFTGSVDDLMRRLVDSRYFCDRSGRKMKYLFMNMLQALANYMDPQNVGPDFDIKKGIWQAQAPLKGNRFTRESRGLDAPKDAFDAMLQLRLWRAIDAWALSDRPIPSGVVSQETYLDYGNYARSPDIASAEFRRFMTTLGMNDGFDRLYEVWLWRRISEVQTDINAGTLKSVEEQLAPLPRQFDAFGPGVSKPRTSPETEAVLKNFVPRPETEAQRLKREERAQQLLDQQKRRDAELNASGADPRLKRDESTAIRPDTLEEELLQLLSPCDKLRSQHEASH